MKFRTLVTLALGIFIGAKVVQKMKQDDPDVVVGPRASSGTSQVGSAQAQRLMDQASVISLAAIRRARGAIRTRLGEDDASWN